MNSMQFLGAIEMGLIYGLVAVGVYLSFRVLDFPDLTVDGSFPLGAAISSILIINGYSPWLALLAALLGGSLSGLFTAWLNIRWKILHLLAGIITMTALYSINLRIMGGPNLSIFDQDTVFHPLQSLLQLPHLSTNVIFMGGALLFILMIFFRFLLSDMGLAMRATGQNLAMAKAQGIGTNGMTLMGLAIANAFAALAGALFAQSQGFADVQMGVGTILVGLAGVLIGEAIFHTRLLFVALIGCILGSVIYRFVYALALNTDTLGLQASDLNLITAALVTLAMISAHMRKSVKAYFAKRRHA
ncbi:MAG: ABC transporter permease [Alphaproteobacteria bacterium]|jgi:putative tryptophan/tyrosine transport system permease protein|nr:ABC transporter permease [Alphaproteobacteria bacterium]MBT5389213.1 ABC transporter permease [Alphaproteobacteria bacterium]